LVWSNEDVDYPTTQEKTMTDTNTPRAQQIDQLASRLLNELRGTEEELAAEALVGTLFRLLGPVESGMFFYKIPVISALLSKG
jgi:hypothetical protein